MKKIMNIGHIYVKEETIWYHVSCQLMKQETEPNVYFTLCSCYFRTWILGCGPKQTFVFGFIYILLPLMSKLSGDRTKYLNSLNLITCENHQTYHTHQK